MSNKPVDKHPLFLTDAETTGLDAEDNAEPFEVAWGWWDETGVWRERVIWLPVDLTTASEDALSKNRYYERVDECTKLYGVSSEEGAKILSKEMTGKQIGGANPAFDMRIIRRFLRKNKMKAAWFFRPLDVTDYAAGFVGLQRPWNLDSIAKALGVPELPAGERHTALGDVRLTRDVYLKASELQQRIEFFKSSLRGARQQDAVKLAFKPLTFETDSALSVLAESIAKAQVEIIESRGKKESDKKAANGADPIISQEPEQKTKAIA